MGFGPTQPVQASVGTTMRCNQLLTAASYRERAGAAVRWTASRLAATSASSEQLAGEPREPV